MQGTPAPYIYIIKLTTFSHILQASRPHPINETVKEQPTTPYIYSITPDRDRDGVQLLTLQRPDRHRIMTGVGYKPVRGDLHTITKTMKTIPKVNTRKDLTKLEQMGVIIEFDPQPEDLSPRDTIDDEKYIQEIAQRAESGDLSAWFCAKVTVKFKNIDFDDYLGGCSYKSFKDFTETQFNGYYKGMINQCIHYINKEITANNQDTIKNWTIRKAKNMIRPYGFSIIPNNAII